MKQIFLLLASLSLSLAACKTEPDKSIKGNSADVMTTPDTVAGHVTDSATPVPDSATAIKNWQEYMTPSAVHKMIAGWSGKWNGEVTMWETASAPAQKSKLETINRMVLGNRYQESHHSGLMMGMHFEGMGTLAYDNARKLFISTWIDNMGTGLVTMEGNWDEASKTINFTGNMVNPSAGSDRQERVRETYTVIDDHTHLMEMFAQGKDGKEFKTMEIKYSR